MVIKDSFLSKDGDFTGFFKLVNFSLGDIFDFFKEFFEIFSVEFSCSFVFSIKDFFTVKTLVNNKFNSFSINLTLNIRGKIFDSFKKFWIREYFNTSDRVLNRKWFIDSDFSG
jgi:hypothetical protein